MRQTLKIGIQKSGKLNSNSVQLLKDMGLEFCNQPDQLSITTNNFPLEVFFLRDDDIPRFVKSGVLDIGIVGENIFLEHDKYGKIISRLGFGQCRLSIAIPKDTVFSSVEDFQDKKIATSHTNLLFRYLTKNKINASIRKINGSAEIAVDIGLADAVCDLVISGKTLEANNLKEVEVVLESEAVLIANKFLSKDKCSLVVELVHMLDLVKCKLSKDGEHSWVHPRFEDSIDKDRSDCKIYCERCFIKK